MFLKKMNFLPQVTYLLIVTSTCLFIININNEELIFYLDFNDTNEISDTNINIGLVRYASIAISSDNSEAYINVLPLMGESLVLIKVFLKQIILFEEPNVKLVAAEASPENNTRLTFLNSVSKMPERSLLTPKEKSSATNKTPKKPSSHKNLPVTFHANVKSSGYGTLHKPVVLFQPQTFKTPRIKSEFRLPEKFERKIPEKEKYILKEYQGTTDFRTISLLHSVKSAVTPNGSALQITVDGKYASCTSSNGLIDILKIGKDKVKITHTLNAHNGEVNSAKWSHTEKLLVSSGNDKTVKIWDFEKRKQEPLLIAGVHTDSVTGLTKSKYIFEEAIVQAQFYYLDRFILVAAGNTIYLFEYAINVEKTGIKSFVNKSSMKVLKKYPLNVKRITTLAAMNQFFSNLVLCGGSSKCIDVVDISVGQVIRHIEDASSRPLHLISLNEGSPYTSHSPATYDILLTTAQFDGIKLWDLRSEKPVLFYKEHRCRSFQCGATFSPCGRYIATGSEDKSVYIYDTRQLSHVHKFSDQHTDVFTSVAFTPKSQILASSSNGLIHFYGQRD